MTVCASSLPTDSSLLLFDVDDGGGHIVAAERVPLGFGKDARGGIGGGEIRAAQEFAQPERFLDVLGHTVAQHHHGVAVLAGKGGFFGVHVLEDADRCATGS